MQLIVKLCQPEVEALITKQKIRDSKLENWPTLVSNCFKNQSNLNVILLIYHSMG